MGNGRFGAGVVAAVAVAAVLAIPQSRSAAVVTVPVDPPRVQVELGALERAATPLPVLPSPVPAASTAPLPVPSAVAVQPVLDGGIPVRVLAAYRLAAGIQAAADPGCGLDWALLAGIGRIESGHASGGRVDAAGTTRGRILGPVLDGSLPGTMVIADSDGGALDGDVRFDRATGPMQFLPSTWRAVGADGNGDGVADPNNVDDAALGAARYLCAGGGDLRTAAGATAALFRYNRSAAYGADVLAWAAAYRTGVTAVPGQDGPVPAGAPAPQVLAAVEGAPAAPPPVVQGPVAPALPTVGPPSSSAPTSQSRPSSAAPPSAVTPTTTPPTSAPTTPVTTPPPATTPPVTTAPATMPPATTSPVTTPPIVTPPVTTAPVTPTAAPTTVPACPAATTVAASATRALPDASGLLLRFALPAAPAGCGVATATLRIDPGPAAETLTVRRPTEAWSATTTAEPASAGPAVVSAPAAGPRRLTVTALVAELYAGPDNGLLVQGSGAPTGPVRLTVTFTR